MIKGNLEYVIDASNNAVSFKISPYTEPVKPRKYFPPVGTLEERHSNKVWPGEWIDANGYMRWYYTGSHWAYHTGADLNLNRPTFDSDAHSPVYSIGDGFVYAVRQYAGWDWVICIQHEDVLSRYGHTENIQVEEGQTVEAGQHIADVGNAGGNYPYHLHFDVAKLDARMREVPGDWPRDDKERVLRDYLDPKEFLIKHALGE
jgi:murein DD-endopeptidase MepM/ murein hydrolase activator NlpD